MMLHFAGTPTVIVHSAELAQEITKNHDVVFADRPRSNAGEVFFYGCSDLAFCPYGEYWRQVKKICVLELLSQKRVMQFHYLREEETIKLVNRLKKASAKGQTIDLSEMLITTSNNIVSRSALGRVYDSENDTVGVLVRGVVDLVGAFNFKDVFPYLWWVDVLTGFNSKVKVASKALHDFLDEVIDDHVKSNTTDDAKRDIVDILLHLQKAGKIDIELSRENLKAILLDMFVAGTDTTATAMDWTMAELIKAPRIMKKVQEEVRRVAGNKPMVEESDIDQMPYLRCVVKETLRLHSSGVIPKKTTTNAKLGGYDIPAKTRVLISAWAIGRDPKLWDKADEYMPERFLESSVDYRGQHKEYIPFGAGRRICPGISYALREVEFVLANLLFLFDWKLPGGVRGEDLDMTEEFTLVIRKKEPLHVIPVLRSV